MRVGIIGTTEVAPNNQVDEITSPVNTSQPLPPPIPEFPRWTYEWNDHGDKGRSHVWVELHKLLL